MYNPPILGGLTFKKRLIRSYAFLTVGKKASIILLLLTLSMLSGCILYDYYEKVKNILESPPRYEWVKTVQVEDKFGWLDIVNEDMAKSSDYPLFLKNGTKYLHIYIKVDFSNPITRAIMKPKFVFNFESVPSIKSKARLLSSLLLRLG